MIEIKDIEKIELKDNEILLFIVPKDYLNDQIGTIQEEIQNFLPSSWQGKVIIVPEDVKIKKITQEKFNESE